MKRYILTPRAKRDVNDIWDYIASDNIEAADRVLDTLESKASSIRLRKLKRRLSTYRTRLKKASL